jgi:hypothetical protein
MAPPDFARRSNYAREMLYFFLNRGFSGSPPTTPDPSSDSIRYFAAYPIATHRQALCAEIFLRSAGRNFRMQLALLPVCAEVLQF